MDLQQQYQPQDGVGYGLAGGQGFYTLESLEASQQQQQHQQQEIYPPGIFYAFQSSDGTIPPGSHPADLTMQQKQVKGQDHGTAYHYHQHQGHMNIPAQGSYGSAQADYGRAGGFLYSEPGSYAREYPLPPRLAPGSIAPPRYAPEEHYIPQEGHAPWLRDNAFSGSSSLLQQQSSIPFAAAAEWKPSLVSLPYRGLAKPSAKSQVWTSGSRSTAKKKVASQFKGIPASHATKKKSNMQPPKQLEPVLSGPGGPGWCSVCDIECNSSEVLESHYLGRKHKRRLEKREELLSFQKKANEKQMQQPGPVNIEDNLKRENKKDAQILLGNSLKKTKKKQNNLPDIKSHAHQQEAGTGKVEHLDKNQNTGGEAVAKESDSNLGKRKQKTKAAEDNIDTKRQRLLDAGTAITEVKICTLCNAVCNSQIVFDSHLAGKKHAAQVKKLEEANTVSQANTLVEEANTVTQGNKIEEEANADSQCNDSSKELIADGELDN